MIDVKEEIWLTDAKYLRLELNTSWVLYTCMYNVPSCWHKYRKQNMPVKQRVHKCSLVRKNK